MGYFQALNVLIRKNIKLTIRDYVSLGVQLIAPLLVMLLLFISQKSYDNGLGFDPEGREDRDTPIEPLGAIPRCHHPEDLPCLTLVYAPDEVRDGFDVPSWVNSVAERNGIPDNEVRGFADAAALNSYLIENPNSTMAAYVFEDYDFELLSNDDVSFVVQYNTTAQLEFPLGATRFNDVLVAPSMTIAMSEVIMSSISGREISFNLSKRAFPHPNVEGISDAFFDYGPLLLFGCYMVSFIFFLYKLVVEKENRLREAMRMSGMSQSQHFLSWGLTFAALMFLTSMLLIVFGYIFRFDFFLETDFAIIFLTFVIFGFALIPTVFLLGVLTRKAQSVNGIVFSYYIVTYLMASSQELIYGVAPDGEPFLSGGVTALREVFAIFPATMFVRAVQTIASASLLGNGLKWEGIDGIDGPDNFFPVRTCWIWMVVTSLAILVLTIYLDNVLPSGFGRTLPWYYPVKPSYWRRSKPSEDRLAEIEKVASAAAAARDNEATEEPVGDQPTISTSLQDGADIPEDEDVVREREAIKAGAKNETNSAVVIKGIRKQYRSLVAVDDVYLSIPHESLFCLLGHNGAGKSTLFSMLTGVTGVTTGDADIYGTSIRTEQDEIRTILGVCPQHDILWDSLTCGEHIELFAALKGVPRSQWQSEIEMRLKQVELLEVTKKWSGQLSGGMQRRLSVAIALTGDPKIVFLDEPTTGMDPVSRRQVWEMIQGAKKGRVIVLVTHSMEEADVLGDSVGIMARGKLRVLGSPLRLKSKFGAGYKLVALSRNPDATTEAVRQVTPGAEIVDTAKAPSGDCINEYAIPRSETSLLRSLVQTVEQRMSEIGVLSFSISESSLEEVFLRVTGLHVDEDQTPTGRQCCCCRCY